MSWRSTAPSPICKEFESGDQKNYVFSVLCPSTGKLATKCKAKGIALNNENSNVVNFATLRDMIMGNARQCMYTIRVRSTKENKVVFKKRRLIDKFDSVPYGY